MGYAYLYEALFSRLHGERVRVELVVSAVLLYHGQYAHTQIFCFRFWQVVYF